MFARPKAVIFDLDGTLIDSATGVLCSLKAAFTQVGLKPIVPITPAVIGPPLRDVLDGLTDNVCPSILDDLVAAFVADHDSYSCLMSVTFDGVHAMLSQLKEVGVELVIATNKRRAPTEKILAGLSLSRFFDEVFCADDPEHGFTNKGHMLRHIIAKKRLLRQETVYVGDREEDSVAASDAGSIPFIFVSWGYGQIPVPEFERGWKSIDRPDAGGLIRAWAEQIARP